MNLGCRFLTVAFVFSERFKSEMHQSLIDVKKIKNFLLNTKSDHKVKIVCARQTVSSRGKEFICILS